MDAGNVPASKKPSSKSLPVNSFSSPIQSRSVNRSNIDIAQEFMDLTFTLESGAKVKYFTRFSGPITVAFTEPAPTLLQKDLQKLVTRLRAEAGLNISIAPSGSPATIAINRIPSKQLRGLLPGAACFVIPNVSNVQELRAGRRSPKTNWTQLSKRTSAAIFMPNDIAPQEARDCLHEEVAQALGPLNDLYRVSDTVFNDDNMHLVLTPFDMLILRATYSPRLQNGMTENQVASQISSLINSLNPSGLGYGSRGASMTSADWKTLIYKALGRNGNLNSRISNISQAIQLAQDKGYKGNRLAFAYFSKGHINAAKNPRFAANDFAKAYNIYKNTLGDNTIQVAQAGVQLASLALSKDDPKTAMSFITPSIAIAKKNEDAGLLFRLLALKAQIAKRAGREDEALALDAEARAWARYAIKSESVISQLFDSLEARPAS